MRAHSNVSFYFNYNFNFLIFRRKYIMAFTIGTLHM